MRPPTLLTEQAECTAAIIEWLHQVWTLSEQGQSVQPDPFYDRNALLTPEIVENVVNGVEGVFLKEIAKFPGYHRNAQGLSADEVLAPPGFDRMPYEQKLAVVQGIDRICKRFEPPEIPATVAAEEPAPIAYC